MAASAACAGPEAQARRRRPGGAGPEAQARRRKPGGASPEAQARRRRPGGAAGSLPESCRASPEVCEPSDYCPAGYFRTYMGDDCQPQDTGRQARLRIPSCRALCELRAQRPELDVSDNFPGHLLQAPGSETYSLEGL
jgi:hypothetical protein